MNMIAIAALVAGIFVLGFVVGHHEGLKLGE